MSAAVRLGAERTVSSVLRQVVALGFGDNQGTTGPYRPWPHFLSWSGQPERSLATAQEFLELLRGDRCEP